MLKWAYPPLILNLKVDVPILPCVFYTFSWLTLTSEMYFVRFHPEVTSCLLSRGKTKYATLGMRLWYKYIRNYLLVYQLISHFLPYLRNYKEFEGEILDLQLEKYGLSFETKKYTTSGWARGDENVIGIRAFNTSLYLLKWITELQSRKQKMTAPQGKILSSCCRLLIAHGIHETTALSLRVYQSNCHDYIRSAGEP